MTRLDLPKNVVRREYGALCGHRCDASYSCPGGHCSSRALSSGTRPLSRRAEAHIQEMKFQSTVPIAQPIPKCLLSPHQVKGFMMRIQGGQSSAGLGDAVEAADSGLSCSEEVQARASFVGTPLFPGLWRPRQGDLCEFAASPAYRV